MNISLRKGTSYLSLNYQDGDFSNNLYCSDSRYIDDKEKILLLDFYQITHSRTKTNSNDDLDDLRRKVDLLESIHFSDSVITEKLLRKIKQNEEILVRFISDSVFETKMKIVFKNKEEFSLVKV